MKIILPSNRKIFLLAWKSSTISVIVSISLTSSSFATQAPQWWKNRGVILFANGTPLPSDDYAIVNQGQVKNIAKAAAEELNANLPGGAGASIRALISKFSLKTPLTDDYAAVNLGQLKTIAKPFYDRLIAIGYVKAYPWANSKHASDDYALANIGQVKNLFSFDIKGFKR